MSRINDGLYSSNDQTWETPPHVWQAILGFEGVGKFDLDVASSSFNIPARLWLTEQALWRSPSDPLTRNCGLTTPWTSSFVVGFNPHPEQMKPLCWMNPPYGTMLKKFMEKAYKEAQNGCKIWALIPARTETQYQHEYGLTQAGFTVFLKGRLHFLQNGEDKGSAPFPTMLLYYGDDADEKAKRWASNPPLEGTLMKVMR